MNSEEIFVLVLLLITSSWLGICVYSLIFENQNIIQLVVNIIFMIMVSATL